MNIFGLVGAGGFGREVMPIVLKMIGNGSIPSFSKVYFIEEGLKENYKINNIQVVSDNYFFNMDATNKYFNIAVADYAVRERVSHHFKNNNCKPFSIQSANSLSLVDNEIDEGSIICPFATITANSVIGKYFHANIYSYVAHDCIIGNYVTFAPRVCCNGNVVIEDYAYIGTNAIIKQGSSDKPITIGKGAVIGMGAVVTKSVPANSVVIGNPAELLKKRVL